MDAGWVEVVILVLTECVAPAGKTVCQEQELRYEFFDQKDCDSVLEQLLAHKDGIENIIVNREKSACLPSAKRQNVYPSVDAAEQALAGLEGWGEIPISSDQLDFKQQAHLERLGEVAECSAVGGVAPCKIGEIIVEGASEQNTQVWRRKTQK